MMPPAPASRIPTKTKILAQIEAPHFCAGLVLVDDTVNEAPPVLKYMVGWSRDRVRDYCKDKGWRIVVVRNAAA